MMPTYNYVCKECEDATEVIQKISADPLTTCTKCGAEDGLKKVMVPSTTGGFQLKGKGWFKSGGY